MSIKKDWKELLESAEEQGGTLKPIKNGVQVYAPNGKDIATVHGRRPEGLRQRSRRVAPGGFHMEGALTGWIVSG